jgi:hypothetical protein
MRKEDCEMTQATPLRAVFTIVLFGIAAMVIPVTAMAAESQVYRCGDTYSQTPCGNNATQPKLYGAKEANNAGVMEKAKSCAAAVAESQREEGLDWQLLDATEPAAELIPAHGTQVLGFRLTVTMALTTAQGQRVRGGQFSCAVSQDFQRVLAMQPLP